jgi:hypothetical protein
VRLCPRLCLFRDKRVVALPLIVAALLLSSCGSSAPKTTPATTLTRQVTSLTHAGPRPTPGIPVGVSQRVAATGTTLVVRPTEVIDPLVASGAKVPPGMVPVGVVIDVRNAGPGGYDSSYTSDFSLRTAVGRATPVFVPRGVCQTYVQDFMNALGVGESRTGCISYLIPRGKPPVSVTLAPDGGEAHSSVTWVVR